MTSTLKFSLIATLLIFMSSWLVIAMAMLRPFSAFRALMVILLRCLLRLLRPLTLLLPLSSIFNPFLLMYVLGLVMILIGLLLVWIVLPGPLTLALRCRNLPMIIWQRP